MKSFYKNQNLNLIASTAQQIVFNNSKNGKLESTNTQDAIDEISNILDEEKTMISDEWNSAITYEVGQYCIYNNTLWKCLVQHNGQVPSEGTYWTKTQIDDEMLAIKNDISTLNSNFKKSEILSKPFECTVNQNGIQALDLETDIYLALQIRLNQHNYFATVRSLTSALWYVVVENYDGTRVPNVTVSGTVYYVIK